MFVYLIDFIVTLHPIILTFLLFLPASINYRLLCGQGLIMACIKSVFNKLELTFEVCHLTRYSGEF